MHMLSHIVRNYYC